MGCETAARSNSLTERVLELVGSKLGVGQVGSTIVVDDDECDGMRFAGEIADDATGTDFGIVLRIRNPFSERHRLVVLAGSHTFGTVAAARFIASSPHLPKHDGDVAIVIKTRVERGHALAATVVWSSDDG